MSEKKELEAEAMELYDKLQSIVSDFDLYGEVHQSDENNGHGEFSAIGRARAALSKFRYFNAKWAK